MIIDKYKKDDGAYYDDGGCRYDNSEDWMQTKELGFCGCGNPELNLQLIRDGLNHINKMTELFPYEQHLEWQKKWESEGIDIFKTESLRYFFFYWADNEGLIDHGSSLPGCLSERGIDILSDLNEMYPTK